MPVVLSTYYLYKNSTEYLRFTKNCVRSSKLIQTIKRNHQLLLTLKVYIERRRKKTLGICKLPNTVQWGDLKFLNGP